MESNKQYEEMLTAAIRKLEGTAPREIAERGNLQFDTEANCFLLKSFSQDIKVSYPDFSVTPQIDMWKHLTILQYMAEADGTSLTGNYMSLSEFKEGGLVRGSSFGRENDKVVQRKIGKAPLSEVQKAVTLAGGTIIQGKGDLSAKFSFLPNFPLILNLWLEDEEFPAACNILFDKSAEHYLKVEAAGTVAGLLLMEIENYV